MSRTRRLGFELLLTSLACIGMCSASAAAEATSPLTPAESLRHFQLDTGLAVELVACEPQVIDPIAIRFDEDGRLWVVEMRDYPHGPAPGEKPRSQIRVLTDADGDGRYETSRVFADELLFPTGIQPWQGGVFVTLAGAVVYLKDTDGDGRADVTETWFRGFAEENPQLRANHPRLAFDGRVYVANGLRGGAIIDVRPAANGAGASADDSARTPLSISGRDFCFDPRSGACEAVSGNGQFGLAFDDFGNRFVCNNRAPLQHVVLENRTTARNPFLAVPSVIHDVAAAGEHSRVYPLTAAWTTSNLHAGQFTAACGATIYRGDALGDAYRGNALVCEPTGSLVHREVLEPDGVSFASRVPHEGREFLASPDPWFRPVNLESGPEGALYVVDMYRAVIEHPQFMPSELQSRPDLRSGDDRGRIYRIVRADAQPRRKEPKLSVATAPALVALLLHENGWHRDTAARLLIERGDASMASALETTAAVAPEPYARVAALHLLANLGHLPSDAIARAMADDDSHVREQAVALAEPRLAVEPKLTEQVIAAAADRDPRVRFRVALVLGGLPGEQVVQPLAKIALARPDDAWTRTAVAAALPSHAEPVLAAVLQRAPKTVALDDPVLLVVRELAAIVGASRDAKAVAATLRLIGDVDNGTHEPARLAALVGLAEGIERRGSVFRDFVGRLPNSAALDSALSSVFARAREQAADESQRESLRAARIELVAFDRTPAACDVLLAIISSDASQALRLQAAAALASNSDERIGPALISSYATQTPAMRRAILDVLVARPERAQLLLDEIEAQRIARSELDTSRAARLTGHSDPTLRERARKLLAQAPPADRQRVLAEYQAALALDGDPRAGRELFRAQCATCHRVAGIGVDVAPDISDSRVKTPEQLLVDILNPNQAIDNNYATYTVTTVDGTVHTGIIAAETAGSITLRQPENKTVDLLRADVETIRANGVSLMPEGLEKQLSVQQMAQVISFVKNWRYLEQPIPGTVSGAK